MKGILFAGRHASQRLPLLFDEEPPPNLTSDPQLLDFSLAVLMQTGVREICLVAPVGQLPTLRAEYGLGDHLGLSLSYQADHPDLAGLLTSLSSWLSDHPVAVVQGDFLLAGEHLATQLRLAIPRHGASTLAYRLPQPAAEDPLASTRPSVALCGVSMYDERFTAFAQGLEPAPVVNSLLELQRIYLRQGSLQVVMLDPSIVCLDCSARESLLAASLFIQMWERSTGRKLACLEEIALHNDIIDLDAFDQLLDRVNCPHKRSYLKRIRRQESSYRRRAA
ncbi:MAG: hypothetical protein SNJ82_07355 [Gemmataceae bacterium]